MRKLNKLEIQLISLILLGSILLGSVLLYAAKVACDRAKENQNRRVELKQALDNLYWQGYTDGKNSITNSLTN